MTRREESILDCHWANCRFLTIPMNDELPKVIIYADGAAEPNPGPGGFGVVLLFGDRRKELNGAFRLTTNNRMEVLGAIRGLEALKKPCNVVVTSDSKYLVDAMSKGWAQRWPAKGWRRKGRASVVNADLWKTLLALCAIHQVEFKWIRGHAGHVENERCDALSVQLLRKNDLPADVGYEQQLVAPPIEPPKNNPPPSSNRKMVDEGQPCRECGTPVVKRLPRSRKQESGKTYYYEWYRYCPGCRRMYMVPSAKRFFE